MSIILRVDDRKGSLLERLRFEHEMLAKNTGSTMTSIRGQMAWVAKLYVDGIHVATCKRGVWTEVKP